MRIEIVNDEDIDIFINTYQFNGINLNDKETLLNEIKDILIKIDTRYRLNLNGFYKIKVYPNQR